MFRSDLMNYDFMGSMMNNEVLGYRLDWRKKLMLPVPMMGGWSPYVVDVEDRTLFVMDPCETSVYDDEMCITHEEIAELVLDGLRKCMQVNIAGCYVVHYIWEYNGPYLERQITGVS